MCPAIKSPAEQQGIVNMPSLSGAESSSELIQTVKGISTFQRRIQQYQLQGHLGENCTPFSLWLSVIRGCQAYPCSALLHTVRNYGFWAEPPFRILRATDQLLTIF